jgi:hypothetical protein
MAHTYSNDDFITFRLQPDDKSLSFDDIARSLDTLAIRYVLAEEISTKHKNRHYHAVVQFDPPLKRQQLTSLFNTWEFPTGNGGRSTSPIKTDVETTVTYFLKDGKYITKGFPDDYIAGLKAQSYPKLDFNTELQLMEERYLATPNPNHYDTERLITDRIDLSHRCKRTYNPQAIRTWALNLLHRANSHEKRLFIRNIVNTVHLTETSGYSYGY